MLDIVSTFEQSEIVAANARQLEALAARCTLRCGNCGYVIQTALGTAQNPEKPGQLGEFLCGLCADLYDAIWRNPGMRQAHQDWLAEQQAKRNILDANNYFQGR